MTGNIEDVQAVFCQGGQDALSLLTLPLLEGFHNAWLRWLLGCTFFFLILLPFLKVDRTHGFGRQRGRGCVYLFFCFCCWRGHEVAQPLAQRAHTESPVH